MENKNNYYSKTRLEIFDLIPKNDKQNILEVGCGYGYTLKKLKEDGYASFTMGIEKNKNCQNKALQNKIDYFICDDVENVKDQINKSFDVILFLDVLEHLVEPWDLFKEISKLLNKNGTIIISLPNIRNLAIIYKLIFKGTWDYQEYGILDKTHLRFFTDKSIRSNIKLYTPNLVIEDYFRNYDKLNFKKYWFKFIPGLKDFITCQFIYKITLNENI